MTAEAYYFVSAQAHYSLASALFSVSDFGYFIKTSGNNARKAR